ncbi:MAG: UbiA family prenyltransferase [Candidatus Micrarchaeia archaeon]
MRQAGAYPRQAHLGIPRVIFARAGLGIPMVMFATCAQYRLMSYNSRHPTWQQPFPFFYGLPEEQADEVYLGLKRLFSRDFYKDMMALAMPSRALPAALSFAAGTFMGGSISAASLGLGITMLVSAYCAAAVFNNISDIEGDKLNNPSSPLASGRYGLGFAWGLMAFFIAASLAIGYLVSPAMALLGVFYAFMGVIYSKFTKGFWPLSYATLITTHLLVPIAVGYSLAAGHADAKLLVIVGFIFVTEFFSFSIKDYKDVEGDKKMGMSTMPISLGPQTASKLTSFGLILPAFSIWVPLSEFRLSYLFLILYFAAWLIRASIAKRLVRDQSPGAAAEMVKKYRIILLLQMCAWCLAWV